MEKIKNFEEFTAINIDESSIYAKKRNEKNAIDSLTKSKHGYNHIRTFGIITSENPNSRQVSRKENKDLLKQLQNSLKQDGYIWVSQIGEFNNNKENSLFIFNIKLEILIYYAEKFQQTSFFFCEIIEERGVQKTKASYYQVHDDAKPYDEKTNPHELLETTTNILIFGEEDKPDACSKIGKKFKYTFPMKCFGYVEDGLSENLTKNFPDSEGDVVDSSINRMGYYAISIRHRLNEGITDKLIGK